MQEKNKPELIRKISDKTAHGAIFRISNSSIIKVYYPWIPVRSILNELNIAKFLFINKVSVPKPKGVYEVSKGLEDVLKSEICIEEDWGRNMFAILMEHIPGDLAWRYFFNSELKDEITTKLREEYQKCMELGFIINNPGYSNSLYSPYTGKVYLIDFMGWRKK